MQSFDKVELLECIRRLVEVDKDWVPDSVGASLYVRPAFLGNEVGTILRAGGGAGLGNQTGLGGSQKEGLGTQTPGSGEGLGVWTPGSLKCPPAHLSLL